MKRMTKEARAFLLATIRHEVCHTCRCAPGGRQNECGPCAVKRVAKELLMRGRATYGRRFFGSPA